MRQSVAALSSLAALLGPVSHSEVVAVANGTIQGRQCANANATSFLSIPYAKPPVGNLRFAAPQPYDAVYGGNGTLQATTAAPACPQFGRAFIEHGPQSEDCLFLNVYAPPGANEASGLPVKVFLHGGSNQAGGIANPMYDGCDLATDAVVVTVNYRLGPLGFMSLQSAGLNGNYGLQDQLLALQWVQDNIQAFGGDPTKVLLFGESAGAFDGWAITTLEQAPRLMRAAVMESGGGVSFPTLAEAEAWNQLYVRALNCTSGSGAAVLACARSRTVQQLNTSANALPAPAVPDLNTFLARLGRGEAWGPVVDGDLVPSQPTDVGSRVPAILGSNGQEGSLFVLSLYGAGITSLNASDYDAFLDYNFDALAARVKKQYPLTRFAHTALPVYYAMVTVVTEHNFRCPARRGLAASAGRGTHVWTYSFNHTPSCSWADEVPRNDAILALLGAAHSSEIPFAFRQLDHLPRPNGTCSFSDAERGISAYVTAAWLRMAAGGVPGGGWPAFTTDASQGVNFGALAAQAGPVDYSMCGFWDAIAAEIAQRDANQTATATATVTAASGGSSTASSAAQVPTSGAGRTGPGAAASWGLALTAALVLSGFWI